MVTPLIIAGISLVVVAPVLIVFGLVRIPAVMRRELGAFAIIGPSAAALAVMFVGGGLIQLGLSPEPSFVALGLSNVGIGVASLAIVVNKLRSERRQTKK
jgi:hypothetical protein